MQFKKVCYHLFVGCGISKKKLNLSCLDCFDFCQK